MKNKVVLGISFIMLTVLYYLLSSIIYWAVGSLVIQVFNIDYNWTLAHGAVTALVISVIAK